MCGLVVFFLGMIVVPTVQGTLSRVTLVVETLLTHTIGNWQRVYEVDFFSSWVEGVLPSLNHLMTDRVT